MITANWEKLGLTGCDIQEYESNKNCEVVIDVHTRRLVALQPGDALGALKKSATAEWLCNHLSKMNRRSLYSRVITSESITLKDISQLATRIDDESEKTVDHILTGHQMESEDTIIQSVLSHVNGDDVKRLIVKSWESKRDIISLYTLIKTVDEGLTGKLLPYVKAVTHQCMMMEDDSPYCLLEDRYLECARILRQGSSLEDSAPDLVHLKCDCIHKLVVLREIWSRTEAAEWDQIKEFPKAPVALEQNEHLKELEKAEEMLEEAGKAEEILEEAGTAEEVLKEAGTAEEVLEEARKAEDVLEEAGTAEEVLEEAGKAEEVLEEAGKAEEVLKEAGTAEEVLEEEGKAEEVLEEAGKAEEVLKEAGTAEEVLEEAGKTKDASKQLAKSGISTAGDESPDDAEVKTKRPEPEEQESLCAICARQQWKMPAHANQQQAVHKTETRTTQAAAGQHRKTSELRTKADPVVAPAASSNTDNSVSFESKGAIPKKARSQPANPAASVSNPVQITDQITLSSMLARKCDMAHADTLNRINDLAEYPRHPTSASREKALKAMSRGYWLANILESLLLRIIQEAPLQGNHDPFFLKYQDLSRHNAFRCGLSPWFDEERKIPFFDIERDQDQQTSFLLRKECQPSKAIIACREQLFLAGTSCFFQVLLYEIVLEVLGEKVFDWYHSQDESRLRLTTSNPDSVSYIRNPIRLLLPEQFVRQDVYTEKVGTIKTWSSIALSTFGYINENDEVHAICTDEKKQCFLVPAYFKVARIKKRRCEIMAKDTKERFILKIIQGSLASAYAVRDPDSESSPHHLMAKNTDRCITEMTCRLDWIQIMRIKTTYNKYIRMQAEHNKDQSTRKHKKEERQRYKRQPKKEPLPAYASEQPLLATASGQSLPRELPALACALPSYQDKPTDFEETINKMKTNLIRYKKDYEARVTAENRDRLVSAIAKAEDAHKKLKTTNEIDDDTRNTLDRQISAALKGARKVLDKHANTI